MHIKYSLTGQAASREEGDGDAQVGHGEAGTKDDGEGVRRGDRHSLHDHISPHRFVCPQCHVQSGTVVVVCYVLIKVYYYWDMKRNS